MFPLQQKDELVFGTTTNTIISTPDNIFAGDLITDHHDFPESTNISFSNCSSIKEQQTQIKLSAGEREEEIRRDGDEIRRVMHRDYERQRRQEMSTRITSLRSLLPAEQIKRKRSLSDHMQESVNYIKQLEKNVQELRIRRDKLRKLPISRSSSNCRENIRNCVTVNPNGDGIEILISCNTENSAEIRLSGVIIELLERKLDVISCISSKTTGMFLYKIQAEVSDMNPIDLSMLQESLRAVITR